MPSYHTGAAPFQHTVGRLPNHRAHPKQTGYSDGSGLIACLTSPLGDLAIEGSFSLLCANNWPGGSNNTVNHRCNNGTDNRRNYK